MSELVEVEHQCEREEVLLLSQDSLLHQLFVEVIEAKLLGHAIIAAHHRVLVLLLDHKLYVFLEHMKNLLDLLLVLKERLIDEYEAKNFTYEKRA